MLSLSAAMRGTLRWMSRGPGWPKSSGQTGQRHKADGPSLSGRESVTTTTSWLPDAPPKFSPPPSMGIEMGAGRRLNAGSSADAPPTKPHPSECPRVSIEFSREELALLINFCCGWETVPEVLILRQRLLRIEQRLEGQHLTVELDAVERNYIPMDEGSLD